MSRYVIVAEPAVEADVEAAFNWYEGEEPSLGFELKNFALPINEYLIALLATRTSASAFVAR